jgi:hypothetical protein
MTQQPVAKRYFLDEPRTQILGWVISRIVREVTREEYDAAARRFVSTDSDWYEFDDYAGKIKGRMTPKPWGSK